MVYPNWSECLTLFFVCYFSVPVNGRLLYWLFSAYFNWVQHLNKYSTYIYFSLCAKNCGLQGYPAPKCFPCPADGLSSLFYKCMYHSHNDTGRLQVHWRLTLWWRNLAMVACLTDLADVICLKKDNSKSVQLSLWYR
jgi:hypothetical protein